MKVRAAVGLVWVGMMAALAPGCAAQGPQTSTMTVTTRLVALDVVVVDRNGKFVTGLDKSQFVVTEDGAPQTIRNFDPPEGHAMPGGGAAVVVKSSADLLKIGNAPVNVLVFDEINTPFLQLAYARQMMEKYLKAQPEVLPVPTLFIAVGDKKIAVLHDYTQNRAELLESVKTHTADVDFNTMVNALNNGRTGSQNGMVRTLGAMAQIASSLRGVPGRKNVVWVGYGYDRAEDKANISSTDESAVASAVRLVTNRMLTARVTLYVVDPEGAVNHLRQPLDDSAESVDQGYTTAGTVEVSADFDGIAEATGGRVMSGRNDVDREIGAGVEDGRLYYTLAYSPTSASDDSLVYRRVRVTVKDPSLRVLTRRGYFAGNESVAAVAANTAKKQPSAIRFDLMNAARTTMVYTGLHVEAVGAKNGYQLLVRAKDLQWGSKENGEREAEVTVLAVCYDAKDKELGQHAAELKEVLGADDKIGEESRVGFAFPMAVPAKTARVRFVMRDAATGVLGSANKTQ